MPAQSLQDLKVICSRCHRLSRELAEEALAKFPKETEGGLEVGQDVLCLWRRTSGLGRTFMEPSEGGYKVFAVSWARRGALWGPNPESGQHSDSKQASRVGH